MKLSASLARKKLSLKIDIAKAKKLEKEKEAQELLKRKKDEEQKRIREREEAENLKLVKNLYVNNILKKALSSALEENKSLILPFQYKHKSQLYDIDPSSLKSRFSDLGYKIIEKESYENITLLGMIKKLNQDKLSGIYTQMRVCFLGIQNISKRFELHEVENLLRKYESGKNLAENVFNLLLTLYTIRIHVEDDWHLYRDIVPDDVIPSIESELIPIELYFDHYEKYGLEETLVATQYQISWETSKHDSTNINFPNGWICRWISSADGQKVLNYVFSKIESEVENLKDKTSIQIVNTKDDYYAVFKENKSVLKMLIPFPMENLSKIFKALGYTSQVNHTKTSNVSLEIQWN
jgi:hypothetical protein